MFLVWIVFCVVSALAAQQLRLYCKWVLGWAYAGKHKLGGLKQKKYSLHNLYNLESYKCKLSIRNNLNNLNNFFFTHFYLVPDKEALLTIGELEKEFFYYLRFNE